MEVIFVATEKKKIVLTMNEELYNRIATRAERMGLTQAGFCMYQVSSNLAQMELAEKVAVQAIKEHADNLQHLK